MTRTTITNEAAVRRLVVGLWHRAYTYQYDAATLHVERQAKAALETYAEAAHIGLAALGADVPQAPFGLVLIALDAVRDAGQRPPLTAPTAVDHWRTDLTDAILAQIGA